MLGIDRKAARYVWTAAVVTVALMLLFVIRKTLFVFILAVLFAYLLSPLVNLLDRILPTSRTRTPALALAYVIFLGIVVFLGIEIGSTVADQATQLQKTFPEQVSGWMKTPSSSPMLNSIKQKVVERAQADVGTWSANLLSSLPQAGAKFLSIASDLVYVVIIPILSFFFLKEGRVIREHVVALVDAGPRRVLLDDVLADVHLLLAHYMRALVVLSVAAFAAYSIFFSAMSVPYGVLLAAVAAILEFIPMVGPLGAAVIILVVAGVAKAHVLVILVFLLAYRLFQDYILSPHLMGAGVELHPLLVLFGVFAGAEVAGIPGTFLSVPVLALVRILYLRIRRSRLGAQVVAAENASTPTPVV